MLARVLFAASVWAGTGVLAAASDAPVVRVRDGVHRAAGIGDVPIAYYDVAPALPRLPGPAGPDGNGECPRVAAYDFAPVIWHGQPAPEGGTLSPLAGASTASINNSGTIAFWAQVSGRDRNQGIFIADKNGIRPIVMGCGGGGGSGNHGNGVGDPSPIGGTFSGLFGVSFPPAINDNGDVLFLSDVDGGSSPRGLFMYNAATQQIRSIAAVGDSSPAGTITAVSIGTLNNTGTIAFIAKHDNGQTHILKSIHGGIFVHAKVGDAVPGGGTFSILGREFLGFQDGTELPFGPIPAVNDNDEIAFAAIVSGGQAERGLFKTVGGAHQWMVRRGEATPAGGVYLDPYAPSLNEQGDIAFYADIDLGGGNFTAAWLVGQPGSLRKALAFFDFIDEARCWGLALSRNPVQSVDDCGNFLSWTILNYSPSQQPEAVVLCPADGSEPIIIARQGDPNPTGGSWGGTAGWNYLNDVGRGVFGAFTPGSGRANAYFLLDTWRAGDVNCDGVTDAFDIEPFILALTDPVGYGNQFPNCDVDTADINGDGAVDAFDIEPFIEVLVGP